MIDKINLNKYSIECELQSNIGTLIERLGRKTLESKGHNG